MKSVAVTSRSFSTNYRLRDELLRKYPGSKFNENNQVLSGSSLIDFIDGFEAAITALDTINEDIVSKLPKLKIISKYGVGLDMIDLKALNKYGIKLGWTPGVNRRSVAELALSSAIALIHKSSLASAKVRTNIWKQIKGNQLTGTTFGIIGCGNIGQDLVRLLEPFACNILCYDIKNYSEFFEKYNVKRLPLDDVLKKADIVSLHLPYNEDTHKIMNKEKITCMKKGAFLMNFARGGLVDEAYLQKALTSGSLSGFALDVLEQEPPTNFKIASLPNVIITPHIGGSTEEGILAMGLAAINGIENAKDPLEYLEKTV